MGEGSAPLPAGSGVHWGALRRGVLAQSADGSRERPPPPARVPLTGTGMATLSAQNHGRKMGAGPTRLLARCKGKESVQN